MGNMLTNLHVKHKIWLGSKVPRWLRWESMHPAYKGCVIAAAAQVLSSTCGPVLHVSPTFSFSPFPVTLHIYIQKNPEKAKKISIYKVVPPPPQKNKKSMNTGLYDISDKIS